MNSIDLKFEKTNAMFRFRRFQSLTNLFRFMEMFVFFVLASKLSCQLPFAIRVSVEHFRGVSFAFFSPRFVFVIGNVIILILLFKSKVTENGDLNGNIDVYDEYVKRCEKNVVNPGNILTVATTEIVPSEEKKICRSQSEKLMIVNRKDNQTHRELRRSVTERNMSKKIDRGGCVTVVEEKSCAADELSGEEFRRTVEAFIARQQQSLRDEELTQLAYIGA
ncbi:uncharacterized protein LOC111919058 [Lactuca sativa]|uniref:DUF4408 domain-containing protein n=1 Tax=Lactuca sativa TaxID=4236 RepID=A0A9R1X165_LACSA|nr:uncharacterized protein LOC111919058 [Lactuca sativa]KAJ0195306.1 hypothetical protein LSAT_V11C700378110 [Lactuca sativa]